MMKNLFRSYYMLIILLIISVLFIGCRESSKIANPEEEYSPRGFKGTFRITSPSKLEIWRQSEVHNIEWSASATMKYVKLELMKKNKIRYVISSKTENDGIFTWKIPSQLKNSDMYYVKISFLDNSYHSLESEIFSIRNF